MGEVTVVLSRADFNVIRFALRDQITAIQDKLASLESDLDRIECGNKYIEATKKLYALWLERGTETIRAANSFMSSAGFGNGPERSVELCQG